MGRRTLVAIAGFLLAAAVAAPASAQPGAPPPAAAPAPGVAPAHASAAISHETAPVRIDGVELFRVRGVRAYPAAERAREIEQAILAVAEDAGIPADSVEIVPGADRDEIRAGDHVLLRVHDADARLEDVPRETLSRAIQRRIRTAIERYRAERAPEVLARHAAWALGSTVGFALALVVLVWGRRRLDGILQRRYERRVQSIEARSRSLLHAEQIWSALRGLIGASHLLVALALAWAWAASVFPLFPWTRPYAGRLAGYFVDPLRTMALGLLGYLPNLAFLSVLILVTRYGLRLLYLFSGAVDRGAIRLGAFDRDWAWPTYRIARIAVVAFALVVAYPYIPGSHSEAFKGISLFAGVVFSLGSSSVISNLMAGYSLIYRRTFKVGDRVQIDDTLGDVVAMRLQVTHLRSLKNEEVIVPNSRILTSTVVNYSSYARQHGLRLHTRVGIGYEVPWRQVEAMLLLAAGRTPGLLREPPPFVLQQALADFAVVYEINAHCDDPQQMVPLYTELHRNILDVFNEHAVQIMTPAYVADPAQPKLVTRDQWHAAPAAPDPPPRRP